MPSPTNKPHALLINSVKKSHEWLIFSGARRMAVIARATSNISRTLVGNKIVDNSDVVGASPVGAAPTTSSFST